MNESSSSPAALTEQVRAITKHDIIRGYMAGGICQTDCRGCAALAALDALAEALAQAEKERDALRCALELIAPGGGLDWTDQFPKSPQAIAKAALAALAAGRDGGQ